MADALDGSSDPAAPAPVDEENAAEGDSMDESIDEGESLLKTEAPPEAGPGSPAPSDSVLSEAAKQKFNELIYWSNPKLTALTFLGLNGIFIVLVVVRATLLSIVSTSLMYAIAISVVYHSAAFAYGRFTGQALVLQPYVKQLGQRALSPDFDVDFAYVEDAMAAAPAVTFQTTINKLAGALEGGLNELLVAIWQAIMLKKPFLTAKVFLGAYLLSWLGARLDAFQILWTAVVTLFTLPKLWSLRSRELDEKLAVVRVHARHASLAAYERVAGMLPASVMKDL